MTKIDSFKGKYSFLSNFAPAVFRYEGVQFVSVEAAFQAAKTHDVELRRRIAQYTPKEAKKFGRKIPLRSDWSEVRVPIMKELLRLKFNSDLFGHRQALLDTADAYLEEGNTHHDTFWGTCNGVGENQLGKLLMEIREEIRNDTHIS